MAMAKLRERQEYNKVVSDVYRENKAASQFNKNRNLHSDPINQTMPKYEPKLPSYKRETINYYKNTIQKPEKLRRRNIAPQVQVFKFGKVAVDELELKGHRRKFLGKNANTESRLKEEQQKKFVPKRFPHMAGDPDLLKHSYQNTEPNLYRTTRRNMFNPPARKDLLDDVPDKFKRRINSNIDENTNSRIRSSKSCYFNPKVERLFPDAIDRENYYSYLENKKEKPPVIKTHVRNKVDVTRGNIMYANVKRDRIKSEILNSNNYGSDKKNEVTSKPNNCDFDTYANYAKKILEDRYKDW